MAAKIIVAILLACVCAAYAGAPFAATYAAAPFATYAHAPVATYAHAPFATYAQAPVVAAAPVAAYAAPVAVAAPVAYIDNAHFSYGYNNAPNGRVDVARTGPIASHAYTYRAGTLF